MKIGRNDPCTCGSGLKYKQCCRTKEGKTSPMLITIAVLLGGVIIAGAILLSRHNTQAEAAAPLAPNAPAAAQPYGTPGAPQPPGPVPPGKVWNVEHGHWHDAPGTAPAAGSAITPGAAQPGAAQPGAAPAQPAFTPGPQPPGPVPPGKVWSTEHGHWHDAPK